jgi:hypothetical protein
MIERMGFVQSTSEVVFLGIEMRGDWKAIVGSSVFRTGWTLPSAA